MLHPTNAPEPIRDGSFVLLQLPDFIIGRPDTEIAEATALLEGREAAMQTCGNEYRALRLLCLRILHDANSDNPNRNLGRDILTLGLREAVRRGRALS